MSTPDCDCSDYNYCSNCRERDSTRRDVQTAIELQDLMNYKVESDLIDGLEHWRGWNSNHAREIAELAWVEMFAEKEG